jgi:hypothetical protein
MDRENSLTLIWPNPIPSDPQSEPLTDCATGLGKRTNAIQYSNDYGMNFLHFFVNVLSPVLLIVNYTHSVLTDTSIIYLTFNERIAY